MKFWKFDDYVSKIVGPLHLFIIIIITVLQFSTYVRPNNVQCNNELN